MQLLNSHHTCNMPHSSNHSLSSLYIFSSPQLNIILLIKTLMIIMVIPGGFVEQEKTFKVVASENSLLAAAHDNAGNGNFSKYQIIFDTLQLRERDANDNDSLSPPSMENYTRTTNCGKKSYDTNVTTLMTNNESDGSRTIIVKNKSATIVANTDIMTNTITNNTTSVTSSSSSTLMQQQHLLSRPKRYLSFPEGSSFSVAVCFTVGIIGNPRYNYMSFGLNWGVAYDLPNTTWILNHLHGFAKRPFPVAVWHRRSRRSLYKEIENVVDNMGYNGRDCILRALCESRQYFRRTKMSMVGEMLRTIFSLPKQRVLTRELAANSDVELYDRAYRKARSVADCSEQYDCGFSLLELAFGKYSTPPDGYYTKH